jgi:hypothetical protein
MKKQLLTLTSTLFLLSTYVGSVHAQNYVAPIIGVVSMIAAQNAANKDIANKTTTTATYHGKSFLLKRTPADILIGDATDRIAQLEHELALCHTILLADSTSCTCPPERQDSIRAAIKYIDLARPNWDQKAYRQEFKFYLAEDTRRRLASK